MHTCIHTYAHTYLHTYILTYIHTCIHIPLQQSAALPLFWPQVRGNASVVPPDAPFWQNLFQQICAKHVLLRDHPEGRKTTLKWYKLLN